MKNHIWATILFFGLLSCNNPPMSNIEKAVDPMPIVKYVSTSAYPTAKMTENKKGYVLGERMSDGMGKYTFTFFPDHITLKTDTIVSFIIDKVDKSHYPNDISFDVIDSRGERYLINVSQLKDADGIHINFYEDFRNDMYNGFTKIICKKAE